MSLGVDPSLYSFAPDDIGMVEKFDEKKEDQLCVPLKTLVWQVNVDDRKKEPIHLVTLTRMDQKIHKNRFQVLVRKCLLIESTVSIRLDFASREVAETLTGFPSGAMPPICHTVTLPLFIEEDIVQLNAIFFSVGCGSPGHSLVMTLPDLVKIADGDVYTGSLTKGSTLSKESSFDTTSTRAPKLNPPKDRLSEYGSLKSIRDRAKLICSTVRKKGRYDACKDLIERAANDGEFVDLMEIGTDGNPAKNPLHLASWKGDTDTVVLLVETAKKYYPDFHTFINQISTGIGSYGRTPIFYALTQCREDVANYLLNIGVNLLIVNNKGQTPCSLAVSHMQPATCERMFDLEAEQLQQDTFINYRKTHSDHKKYGDLDPRFLIDEDNVGDGDILKELQAYEKSVSGYENDHTLVPTKFSPRSLRPTVRWWNHPCTDDKEDQACNADSNRVECNLKKIEDNPNENHFETIDWDSLEHLTLDQVVPKPKHGDNFVYVDDMGSLLLMSVEIDRSLKEAKEHNHADGICAWGLDCEWKPSNDYGKDSPVATLQLSSRTLTFLVDVQVLCRPIAEQSSPFFDPEFPQTETLLSEVLSYLFCHEAAIIVGYGVLQDLDKLVASFPYLPCFASYHGVVDLQSVSTLLLAGGSKKKKCHNINSLQKMVAILVNKYLDKSMQCSDWTERPLSSKQVAYAILDAAVLPLLLDRLLGQRNFFEKHPNLQCSVRYTLMHGAEVAYHVPNGKIKKCMSKRIARQVWPTNQETEPPFPEPVIASTETRINKGEKLHVKPTEEGKRRSKQSSIQLLNVSCDFENVPLAGSVLGYTKESCVYSLVNLSESTDNIGFNRRGGVVQSSNAWILFVNFAQKAGWQRYSNEFLHRGRQTIFTLNPSKCIDQRLIHYLENIEDTSHERKIFLFARPSTKSKYIFCGECEGDFLATEEGSDSGNSVDILLDFIHYDVMIQGSQTTPFLEMVQSRGSSG